MGYTQAHMHTCTLTLTRTHARTHTRAHTHIHAHRSLCHAATAFPARRPSCLARLRTLSSSAGRAPCLSINLPHDATGPCPSPTVPGPLSHLSCGLGFPAQPPGLCSLHALTRAATFSLTNAKGRYGPIQQPPWWLPCQPEASRQLHEYPFRGSF